MPVWRSRCLTKALTRPLPGGEECVRKTPTCAIPFWSATTSETTNGCARSTRPCADFGDHLQYSMFECQFTPVDLARCRHVLGEIIKHNEDQVLFVDLGPVEGRGDRVISALGQPYCPLDALASSCERRSSEVGTRNAEYRETPSSNRRPAHNHAEPWTFHFGLISYVRC